MAKLVFAFGILFDDHQKPTGSRTIGTSLSVPNLARSGVIDLPRHDYEELPPSSRAAGER